MRQITYLQAMIEALDEEMARDPSVFLLGEDVGKYWGGAFGEFRGLYDKYGPKRVRQTPISETAIVGAAIGAAITGKRPVAGLMFADFVGIAGDEILNQLTKLRYMFGGKAKLPVTIVCCSGAGVGAAGQHSKCVEGLLMSIPGLKIASPASAYDAKGLLKSAIRDDNPVIYFHHKVLMFSGAKSPVPEEEYVIPLGQAEVKKQGADITVVAIGLMVQRALAAANKLKDRGIDAEIIDPRTVAPLDKKAIIDSVKKTGRLVIMDEEPKTGSAAAEIAAIVCEEAFSDLKAPIRRVCAPDTPVPFTPVLEQLWMPDEEDLISAVVETA
jgi:pyruvate/2-oxoglutarate/acetoin dehydrogenase E1 component